MQLSKKQFVNYIKSFKNLIIMKHLILILSILSFSFSSINAQKCSKKCTSGNSKKITGNKTVSTEKKSTEDYDAISVGGSFDVALVKGKEGEITIQAEENIIPYIIVKVEDNTLKISTKKGYYLKNNKQMIITVPFQDLNAISLLGSGSIYGKDKIESNEFKVKLAGSGDIDVEVKSTALNSSVTGSGDIEIRGNTIDLNAKITGSGDFDGSQLKADNTTVSVTGSGDAEVVAYKNINAKVSGSGDIVYSGNPANVKAKTSGSGDIESR